MYAGTPEQVREINKLRMRVWRAKNKERDNENSRQWRQANPEKVKAAQDRHHAKPEVRERKRLYSAERNPRHQIHLRESGYYRTPEYKAKKDKWRRENLDKARQYARNANKKPGRQLKLKMLSRIWDALRSQGLRKTKRMVELVGCTTAELKKYIESLFADGMTWKDVFSGQIHIDHIVPCCAFDLSVESEMKRAFHFSNLRPLWKAENLKKAAQDRRMSIKLHAV